MGTEDATLSANFVAAHQLTLVAAPEGAGVFRVNGRLYTEPVWIAPGTSVTVRAIPTPDSGYNFDHWTVSGNGSIVSDATTNPTTFTMGTEDATLTATFIGGRTNNNTDTEKKNNDNDD